METGLVTVVVPVYKTEKYLDRCIRSIVNQTYKKLEILLIDDGSPDNCPQICDAWAEKDNRICVIHKKNAGLGMARNTGIELATGEYICFFDSDDYIAVDAIEKAYAFARAEEADITVFGMFSVDKNGNITNCHIPETEKTCFRGKEVQDVFLPDLIDSRHLDVKIDNLCLSACSCLFSMALVRQTEWKFVSEREIISEDSYSIIWLYKHVRSVAVLQEALYFYCENETSLTHVYREDRYPKIKRFYQVCIELADELDYCEEVHESISGVFLSFSIAAMKHIAAIKLDRKDKREMLAQIIDDEAMQRGLADALCRTYGLARRILFWAMRHRFYDLCYILLIAQNASKSNQRIT